MAVVDAEEVDWRDISGAPGAGGGAPSHVIARVRHEPRHDGHRVLHLPPPSDHRRETPRDAPVATPHALPPPRHRLNLAGASARGEDVAGARRG